MAGTPLGIGLGIDFSKLDADLSRVADRIEKVGSETSIKIGSMAGLAAKGDLGADKIAGQVSQIGMSLAQGMASGVRASSAVLLGLGSRINAMVDRIGGMMLTMFNRIDVAMKGHRWTNLLTGLSNSLGNFASGSGKVLSPLDKAMGGAFGAIAKRASQVFNTMFENLGKTITAAMEKAAASMAQAMVAAAGKIETSMKVSLQSIDVTVQSLARTMSTSMIKAIDQIAEKLKHLKVDAAGAAESLKMGGPGRPYVRELGPPERERKPVTVAEKIKMPTETAQMKFAKGVDMRKFGADELAPPAPKKMDFAGSVPKPQMFKEFQSIIKDTVTGIKQIPVAFQAAVASGNQYAVAASAALTVLLKIDKAAATTAAVIVRVGAGFAAMGLAAAAAIGRSISFFQSLGSVGKTSYAELFKGNSLFAASVLATVKTVNLLVRGLWDLVTLKAFRRVSDDAQKFGGAVQTSTGLMGKLLGSVGRLGVELAAAFGVVGLVYKVVQFFEKGVKAATDLNTVVAQSKVVFGESFGEVEAQAEKNAKAYKISKAAQLDLAASFGNMAQGAGIGEAAAAGLANELTDIAVNATGVGVSFSEASEAMKTGLSGRAIALKQLAVNIDDNTTKAYAWSTGIAKTGQELTMQQTLLSRAGQIMRGLSYAQGALASGANLASVQFQKAGGGIALFAEKIGELLLPAVQSGTKGFNALMGGVLDLVDRSAPALQSWSTAASENVNTVIEKTVEFGPAILSNLTWAWEEAKKGPLGFVIEGTEAVVNFAKAIPEAIGIGIRNMGTLWEIAKLEVGAFVTNAMATIRTIPGNFGIIFPWILKNWRTLLIDLGEALKTIGGNLLENAINLGKAVWEALKGGEFKFEWTPLLDGFKATTEQLPDLIKPDLISVGDEVNKLYAKIGENELKVNNKTKADEAAMTGKKPPILPEDKGKEYKLGGALEQGSKEAFSAIARGTAGKSTTTDAVKQNVTVSQAIHKAIQQQTDVIKNKAFAPALTVK